MSFEVLETYLDPSDRFNADQVISNRKSVFVLDGASSLRGETVDGISAAAWMSGQVAKRLQFYESGSIEVFLRRALLDIRSNYNETVANSSSVDGPFACLMGLIVHDDVLELVSWGDCQTILRIGAAHSVERFGYSSVTQLDRQATTALVKIRNECAVDQASAFDRIKSQIEDNRAYRNRWPGYQVLDLTDAVVGYPERRFFALDESVEFVITTDGLLRAISTYGLHDDLSFFLAAKEHLGLASLAAAVRQVESADPDCVRFPRLKGSDDIGAIHLKYTPNYSQSSA